MASKKIIADKTALLFSKPGNNRLIISAHGGAPENNQKFNCPGQDWTKGIPIYRTSTFGLSTTSQVQDIVNYRNHRGPYGAGGNIWQVSLFGGEQTDWLLSEYASSKGDANVPDSYAHYLSIAEHENFDIASPRNTKLSRKVNVSKMLEAIENKKDYKEIWFNFCLVK